MPGLYKKYIISKTDGSPVDPDAEYFVLRIDKDRHARTAILVYAENIKSENEQFYKDILEKLDQTPLNLGSKPPSI